MTRAIVNKAMQFLSLRHEEKVIKTRKDQLRDAIKKYMADNSRVDERGNQYFGLGDTITVDGKEYNALKNERKVSTYLDEDRLVELAEGKGLRDRIIRTIEVVDQDEVYVLNQEGLLTDEELDSLFEERITWALIPIKETEVDSDEVE
jgi:hypothetical protein